MILRTLPHAKTGDAICASRRQQQIFVLSIVAGKTPCVDADYPIHERLVVSSVLVEPRYVTTEGAPATTLLDITFGSIAPQVFELQDMNLYFLPILPSGSDAPDEPPCLIVPLGSQGFSTPFTINNLQFLLPPHNFYFANLSYSFAGATGIVSTRTMLSAQGSNEAPIPSPTKQIYFVRPNLTEPIVVTVYQECCAYDIAYKSTATLIDVDPPSAIREKWHVWYDVALWAASTIDSAMYASPTPGPAIASADVHFIGVVSPASVFPPMLARFTSSRWYKWSGHHIPFTDKTGDGDE